MWKRLTTFTLTQFTRWFFLNSDRFLFSSLGNIDEIILEGRTVIKVGIEGYIKNPDFINGLETHAVEIHEHLPVEQSQVCFIKARMEDKVGRHESVFQTVLQIACKFVVVKDFPPHVVRIKSNNFITPLPLSPNRKYVNT